MISYQFLHLTIIQGYSKLSLLSCFLDKGFPKGGGGPTFGKNSQIISFFFLRAYLMAMLMLGKIDYAAKWDKNDIGGEYHNFAILFSTTQ